MAHVETKPLEAPPLARVLDTLPPAPALLTINQQGSPSSEASYKSVPVDYFHGCASEPYASTEQAIPSGLNADSLNASPVELIPLAAAKLALAASAQIVPQRPTVLRGQLMTQAEANSMRKLVKKADAALLS